MNYAVKYFGLKQNPIRVTGRQGRQIVSQKFWEESDFKKFIVNINDTTSRLVFCMLFYTGMRIGELLALTPADFDRERKTIHINKSFDSVEEEISGPLPKTYSSIRTITIPDTIAKMLGGYIDCFYETPERIFEIAKPGTIRYQLNLGAELAGIPRIRIQDLRHSHASYLIQHNVPITAISKRLGHKDPSITLSVYSHVYQKNDKEIAELLENSVVKVWSK